MKFDAASFDHFKVGTVTPKSTQRKKNTHKAHVQKRRKSYKRSTDVDNGRRRRSEEFGESRRGRKERRMTMRRSQSSKDGSTGKLKPKEDSTSSKERLMEFYKKYNPTKVDEVESLLEKYSGQETELFSRLAKKYNVDPSTFGLDVTESTTSTKAFTKSVQSATASSGFAFGVSSKPPVFGSSAFEGFGVASTWNSWSSSYKGATSSFGKDNFYMSLQNTNTMFGAATSSFTSFSKASSSFFAPHETQINALSTGTRASTFSTKSSTSSLPTFGSLAAPNSTDIGFGIIASSRSKELPGGWGQSSDIRSNSSFDSETMEGMDCD